MNKKTLAALTLSETKFLLHLKCLRSTSLFSFEKLLAEGQSIFPLIDGLAEKEIIDLSIDEKLLDVYLVFDESKYYFKITREYWDANRILDCLKYLFYEQDSRLAFIELVLKPQYLWSPSFEKLLQEPKTIKQADMRYEIVSYIAKKLQDTHNYTMTTAERKNNMVGAGMVTKNYPQLNFEQIKESIDFFLEDKYWTQIIISTFALNKHMPKYLVNSNKGSFKTTQIKLI